VGGSSFIVVKLSFTFAFSWLFLQTLFPIPEIIYTTLIEGKPLQAGIYDFDPITFIQHHQGKITG
jgi:hypothetical protein